MRVELVFVPLHKLLWEVSMQRLFEPGVVGQVARDDGVGESHLGVRNKHGELR